MASEEYYTQQTENSEEENMKGKEGLIDRVKRIFK